MAGIRQTTSGTTSYRDGKIVQTFRYLDYEGVLRTIMLDVTEYAEVLARDLITKYIDMMTEREAQREDES